MDFGQTHAPSWLNASYYSNVPYNEVNWAALAQQWIAMRQTGDNLGAPAPQVVHQQTAPPPLPSCQPPSQPPAPPTGFESPVYPPNTADFVSQRLDQCFETPLAVGNLASEQIRGPVRNSGPLLATPEMPPMPDAYIIDRSRPERFIPPKPLFQPVRHRFPRYPFETSKAQDFTADSYNMMSAGYYGENESFYTDSMYSQAAFEPATGHFYPPQGASGHFSAHDMDYRKWSGFMANQKSWMMDDRSSSNSPDVPLIDNQQRKLLPAWIREGLEKVEKEKQKKQEEEMRKAQAEAQKDAGRDNKPNKGRFESDSESEGEDEPTTSNREEEETEKLPRKLSPVQKRISRFEPSPQSEEEYKEKLLLLLRRWMTEILLEVTDNEIRTISSEFHSKIRRKGEGAESGESSGEDLEEESGASEKEEDNKQENEEESREGFKRPLEPFSSVIRPVSKQRKQISLGSEPQPKSFKDGEKEQLVVDIGDNTDAAKEKLVGKEVKKSSMSKDKRSRSRSRSPRERKEAKRRYRSRSRSRSPSRERGSHHSHRERDRRKRSRSKERDRDRKHRKDERRKRSDHK